MERRFGHLTGIGELSRCHPEEGEPERVSGSSAPGRSQVLSQIVIDLYEPEFAHSSADDFAKQRVTETDQ